MEAHRGHLGLQQLEVVLVSLPRLEVSHKVRATRLAVVSGLGVASGR